MNEFKRFLLAALLVLLLAAPTQAWVIVQDIGPNNELMDNNTDGMIDFAGRGGADNTDIRFDLDGTYPIISSPTDSAIGVAEILYVTGALLPVSADGSALGSALLEWSDLFLADDAVISLGLDQDTTLTHVQDVGVLLNSSRRLQFGDNGTYLHQSIDGTMGLVGDTIATITAPDIRFQFDAAAYLTIAVANAGAVVISTTSDGTDQITLGDDADIIIIAASTWDVDASGNITTTGDIGSTTVEIDDIFMSDDAVLNFGADQDVKFVHVPDTGLQFNLDDKFMFGDVAVYVHSDDDGYLDLVGDTGVRVSGTLSPKAADGTALGSVTLEWSDLFLADAAVLNFGDDQDVKITHTADIGLTLTGSLGFGSASLSVTTEGDITSPLVSTVLLITGDDDTDNDAIDLQSGSLVGQMITLIAVGGIDANDTMTINMSDTVCTNCAAIVFDKIGESATLIWTGSTWSQVSVSTSL